jgi:hypothetical protein
MSNEPYRSARVRLDMNGRGLVVTEDTFEGGWKELPGKIGGNNLVQMDHYIKFKESEGYRLVGAPPSPDTPVEVDRMTRASKGHLLTFEKVSDPGESTSTQRLMSSFEAGPAPQPVGNPAFDKSIQIEREITPEQEQRSHAANADLLRSGSAALHRPTPAPAPEPPSELSPAEKARLQTQREARERYLKSGGHF